MTNQTPDQAYAAKVTAANPPTPERVPDEWVAPPGTVMVPGVRYLIHPNLARPRPNPEETRMEETGTT